MIQNLTLDDFLDYKEAYVNFNEIIIYKKDLLKIAPLMNLFVSYNIYIEEEIRLDSFALNIQNEIGIIFMKYYNYTVEFSRETYLDKDKLNILFDSSNKIKSILALAYKKTQNKNSLKNNIDILQLTEANLNLIIINFFSKNYRNFSNVEKSIQHTTNFYDANIDQNKFYKIVEPKEFVLTMFGKYIRTSKGEIPFSGDFGSNLKSIIHRKYDDFTKTLLFEEIRQFINEITNLYTEKITLIDVIPVEKTSASGIVKIQIKIIIQINDDDIIQIEII